MALADRLNDRPEVVNGYPCSVAGLIAQVQAKGEDELAALQKMLYGKAGLTEPARGHKGWYEREVFEAVTSEGYDVAKNQINEHRGKRCRCYLDAR